MAFLIGGILVALTVIIHSFGTTLLLRFLLRRGSLLMRWFSAIPRSAILIPTALVLFSLHLLEINLWAIAYFTLTEVSELPTYEDAVYFSSVTYTTLGYGDITLSSSWRILSGMESLNGILLSGWSTALLFLVVQRLWQLASQNREEGVAMGKSGREPLEGNKR